MNKLLLAKRAQILTLLCEGMSMRVIERTVGCSINTVDKLLHDAGEAAFWYHDRHVRGVKATRVQCAKEARPLQAASESGRDFKLSHYPPACRLDPKQARVARAPHCQVCDLLL